MTTCAAGKTIVEDMDFRCVKGVRERGTEVFRGIRHGALPTLNAVFSMTATHHRAHALWSSILALKSVA